jgi:hypothetical protein
MASAVDVPAVCDLQGDNDHAVSIGLVENAVLARSDAKHAFAADKLATAPGEGIVSEKQNGPDNADLVGPRESLEPAAIVGPTGGNGREGLRLKRGGKVR